MTEHGPEAWLNDRKPTTWPEGYKVRFNPTVLLDASGVVVAHEGEMVTSGGGSRPVDPNESGLRSTSEIGPRVLLIQGHPRSVPPSEMTAPQVP
jgi:hypothetical protein